MRILITGAAGFIGRHLMLACIDRGHDVVAAYRSLRDASSISPSVRSIVIGDIATADWKSRLEEIEVVIHLAARVHVMREAAEQPLAEFRRVNVEGTRRLAIAAAAAGVKRFIFVSSIKVNGEATHGRPFRPEDEPRPTDPYAVSKLEAELALAEVCASASMTYTVVRPPLVYGPGVGGNFARLVSLVDRGIPLPLGSIDNRRSMISVGNLVDLLLVCADDARAANQVFLASGCKDWSTPELVRSIAEALGKRASLLSVPPWLLRRLGAIVGVGAAVERLCGSLEVDDSVTRSCLEWQPPEQSDVAIREAVDAWRSD